jgi:hypothetical protein
MKTRTIFAALAIALSGSANALTALDKVYESKGHDYSDHINLILTVVRTSATDNVQADSITLWSASTNKTDTTCGEYRMRLTEGGSARGHFIILEDKKKSTVRYLLSVAQLDQKMNSLWREKCNSPSLERLSELEIHSFNK